MATKAIWEYLAIQGIFDILGLVLQILFSILDYEK